MYIQPNSTIKILENIPLNKSYEHTVYYEDKDKQYEAFNKYTKFTLTDYSYQRSNIGTIRVELKYEDLYSCNYLMFKNTSFENKWFFAFITGVSYVSNEVSEVYYDLDVMQTWCYDYTFRGTFVERQHATNDMPYENTQPEGLEIGDSYIIDYNSGTTFYLIGTTSGDRAFTILATTSPSGSHPSSSINNGTLFSLYVSRPQSDSDAINVIKQFIDNGYEDNIISIYTVPIQSKMAMTKSFKRNKNIDGYTPRNKKLYNSPYCFIELYNNLGEALELKYENFYDNNGNRINSLDYDFKFQSLCYDVPTPQARLLTYNYQDRTQGASITYNTVSYTQFPTGAFSGDSFKVWLAQNKNAYGASLNAVGNTFDTNVAIAQNNYSMAGNSASNARTNTQIASYTQLANASSGVATELNNNVRSADYSGKIGMARMMGGVGLAFNGRFGEAINTVADASANMMQTTVDLANSTDTLNTMLGNATRSNDASLAIAGNNYSTAMKNASLAETNEHLSALNTYQNAINALVAKKQDAQHQPSNLHGAMMNDVWNSGFGIVGFTVSCKTIKREYAEIIDDYFDRYGYAQRRMYVPQRINRTHWSYLKTCGCNITGHMNNSDILTIKGIYDNGITTWRSLEEVGNYALDNTIK